VLGLRRSAETALVLETFLTSPRTGRYGYDLGRSTGLKSGTLYPILMRLADAGVLEALWQRAEPGRPARHVYRLTADGLRTARAYLREYAAAGRTAPLREQLS
jgi:DNA-binding PadR family transcriptional regulator